GTVVLVRSRHHRLGADRSAVARVVYVSEVQLGVVKKTGRERRLEPSLLHVPGRGGEVERVGERVLTDLKRVLLLAGGRRFGGRRGDVAHEVPDRVDLRRISLVVVGGDVLIVVVLERAPVLLENVARLGHVVALGDDDEVTRPGGEADLAHRVTST